jgi:hypothetical protein
VKARYLEVSQRIRGEMPELERLAQRALIAWTKAQSMPGEEAYLDSVALSLHGFYSGLERLFELISRHVDLIRPVGETWHRDLLQQMAREVPDLRPAVISKQNALALDEFRRFRHLIHHESGTGENSRTGGSLAEFVAGA